MIYELRSWSEDQGCLYTDDHRLRDMAVQSNDLRIVGRYFRSERERQPFAWDIVGSPTVVESLAAQFAPRRRGGRGRA